MRLSDGRSRCGRLWHDTTGNRICVGIRDVFRSFFCAICWELAGWLYFEHKHLYLIILWALAALDWQWNSQITNAQNTDKLTTPSSPGAWFWTGAATKTKQRWRLTEISYLFVIAVLKIDEQSTEQWNKSHSGVIFGCGDVRLLKARWCKCCIVRVSSVELQSVPCHFALLFPSFIVRRFFARGQHFGQWEISKPGVNLLSKPAIIRFAKYQFPFLNLPFRFAKYRKPSWDTFSVDTGE